MIEMLFAVPFFLGALLKDRSQLIMENLALRQQLVSLDFLVVPTATFRLL
jgi:hypothetical protein